MDLHLSPEEVRTILIVLMLNGSRKENSLEPNEAESLKYGTEKLREAS
jgi:hypothetical protein